MDEVQQAANDVGMTEEQGETATGGVLSFLKDHLSEEHFKMIETYIPGAEETVQKYTRDVTSSSQGGGFGGMLTSAISSLSASGGTAGGLAGLMAILASKGISPAMVQQFLTKVGPLIQQKCGIDVTKLLGDTTTTTPAATTAATPAATTTAEAAAPTTTDAASDLMGSAMGMFGK